MVGVVGKIIHENMLIENNIVNAKLKSRVVGFVYKVGLVKVFFTTFHGNSWMTCFQSLVLVLYGENCYILVGGPLTLPFLSTDHQYVISKVQRHYVKVNPCHQCSLLLLVKHSRDISLKHKSLDSSMGLQLEPKVGPSLLYYTLMNP